MGRLCSVLLPCCFTVSRRILCNIEQAISVVNRKRTRGGQDRLPTITLPLLTSAKNPSEWTVTSACIGERFFKGRDLCLIVESLAAEIFLPQSVWIVDPMFLNAELIFKY